MATPHYTPDEIARLGKALYERDIRPKVEHDHHGQVIVINLETGEYEIASDHLTAATRAPKIQMQHFLQCESAFPRSLESAAALPTRNMSLLRS